MLLCHWLPVLLSCRLRCIFAVGESHCTVGPVYAIACPACILAPRPAVRRNSSVGMRVVNNVVNFSNHSRTLSDLGGLRAPGFEAAAPRTRPELSGKEKAKRANRSMNANASADVNTPKDSINANSNVITECVRMTCCAKHARFMCDALTFLLLF